MKKKIRLTETELIKLIKKVITEKTKRPVIPRLEPGDTESATGIPVGPNKPKGPFALNQKLDHHNHHQLVRLHKL